VCRLRSSPHSSLARSIVPGQDLGVSLQAGVAGNYGHLPYEKQNYVGTRRHQHQVGTLQATNTRVYEAVEPTVTKLREWVQDQPVHVDETPWPVLGVKEWLWVSAEEKFCLFHAGIPAPVSS